MVKMTQPKIFTRGIKLWIRFALDGETIRKSLNLEDTKANRKIATTQIIPQMLLKAHTGEFFKNKIVPTVKDMIDLSLEMNKKNRKYLTQRSYELLLNKHVIPIFGKRKIDTIKPSELALWQNKLLETLSSKTVTNARVIFHGILEDALRDELINKNPFTLVKAPSTQSIREIKPFSKDEIFKLLPKVDKTMKCYFAIGFFAGLRAGEMMALRVTDIDMKNKIIKVTKSRNFGIESSPKTKSSYREVDILDVLVPYLQEHLKLYPHNDYLFQNTKAKPFNRSTYISDFYWTKALKKSEIEYRNMHQMRHTFASLMISSGEDILWVSSMLGHKNSGITLSVYAKYMKNTKKVRGTFLLAS